MFRFGFIFAAPIVVLTLLALMLCANRPGAARRWLPGSQSRRQFPLQQ